jgi:type I restriction enzyme S subunit
MKTPKEWRSVRLRYLCKINPMARRLVGPIAFAPMDAVGTLGGIRFDHTLEEADVSAGLSYFEEGDVIVAKITPCFENGKCALAENVPDGRALGSTEFHVIRPGSEILPRFLFYAVASAAFRQSGEAQMYGAAGQKRVPTDFIKDFCLRFPDRGSQRAVAASLDLQTSRIDALMAKKQRMIELLDEKRNALISRAITQGLDPSVPMKVSGVPWLGPVPKHWAVKRLARFCFLQRGQDLPDQERENGEVPILSSAGISGRHIRAAAYGPAVVTGRYGSIGRVFYVDGPFWPLNTTLYSVSLFGNDARYVKFMLEHLPLASDSEKSAVPGVNRNYLHTLEVACPPIDEQAQIAAICLSIEATFRDLSGAVQTAIDRLREYRSALITAAVTGQLDLREHEKKMEALA